MTVLSILFEALQARAGRANLGLPTAIRCSSLFDEFENDYLPTKRERTRRSYRKSLRPFRAYFVKSLGDPFIDNVSQAHIKGYLKWRRVHGPHGEKRKDPISNRTLQRDRAILHKIMNEAIDAGYIDHNPVSAVRAPKATTRDPELLTPDQVATLLEQCRASTNPMLEPYVLTLVESGMRCDSECLWLRWEDLHIPDGFLWISSTEDHQTKSGQGRWVPLTDRLRKRLSDHAATYRLRTYGPNRERSPWVFHHLRANRTATAGHRIECMRGGFKRAAERAGLPARLRQHDLRHLRVTSWLAEGGNPVHVKEAVGHADLATTMRYTHLAREHLRSLVDDEPQREQRAVAHHARLGV